MFIVQSSFCPFMTLNWLIKKLKLKIEIIQYKPAEDYCTKSTSIIITKANHKDRKKNQIKESKLKKTTSTMKTSTIFTQKLLWCTMLMNCVWEMRGNCDVTGVFDSSAIHTDNTSLSVKGIGLNRYQRPAHSKQVAFVHTPIDLLSGGRVFCCCFFQSIPSQFLCQR